MLAKNGTYDPVEPRHALEDLVKECELSKISRSPARFDEAELKNMNARLLHEMPFDEVSARLERRGLNVSQLLWETVRENLDVLGDAADWIKVVEGPISPIIEDGDFIAKALDLLPEGEPDGETWSAWTDAVKKATGAKGKSLFMPLRKALTGMDRGPSMQNLLVLMGEKRARARLSGENA